LFEHILSVKSSVLELRNQYQLSPKDTMSLTYAPDDELRRMWSVPGAAFVLQKLSNARCEEQEAKGVPFLAGKYQYQAILNIQVDRESELARMKEELAYYQGFVSSVEKKLSNERFVSSAPVEVVEKERQKKADGEAKIEQLLRSIDMLN
jgi:valyl-tRNA synthetase